MKVNLSSKDLLKSILLIRAAAPGRMEPMVNALGKKVEFIEPGPASERDLGEGPTERIIFICKRRNPKFMRWGFLPAGGAILAGAEMAFEGQSAFGLIRLRTSCQSPLLLGGSVTLIILPLPLRSSSAGED